MHKDATIVIKGLENGLRVDSRLLEEKIQAGVAQGARRLEILAHGQHGIGGRLWISKKEPVDIVVKGSPGQRLGAMGCPGTHILCRSPASDDVGWLNTGAEIVVLGNASNGIANAMAQGRVMVGGNIGARGMTMTKHNPRFDPPELWVLGSAGDYFAEFMAGGVAVICGHEPQNADNVLGFRPCVGMVGGKIFFRGPCPDFSRADAVLESVSDSDWNRLLQGLEYYLTQINRFDLYPVLTQKMDWQLIRARTPHERLVRKRRSMQEFRTSIWDAELGRGGLIGDLSTMDASPIPLVVTGEMRRFVPVWENEKYLSPCEAACPTGIPVQRRWQLIRQGREQEAVDMALQFTPFPATICGYLCPHLCMQSCTREASGMQAVDITILGKKGLQATMPQLPKLSGKSVAVIGGGPAGISAAWHLRLAGHQPVVYDKSPTLGGKIASAIPESRIPKEILESELQRVSKVLDHVHLQESMTPEMFQDISARHEFVILATGADQPRTLPVPGSQRLTSALDFLRQAKSGQAPQGKKMVIIGAGNVGCDVATVAGSMGYTDITLIDVQKPASFGEERKGAEKFGAKFRWPCFTKEITDKGVVLTNGEILEADTVIVSIGDQPDTSYLPASIRIERGFVTADENGRTTDPKIFAVGDIVRPGLLTHAVGAGRRAALTIDAMLEGRHPVHDPSLMRESDRTALEFVDPEAERSETIDYSRITLEYFDPRKKTFNDTRDCAAQCSSCGSCRDCGLCVEICPQGAITRVDLGREKFEMVSNAELCIGCGFCAQACPCGIWSMHPNTPLG